MSTPRRPKAPRKAPTQERAKETIRILMEATDIVVRANGASGVSIAAIAAKAGIAQGSVYQYFPTKAAVLAAWEEHEWSRISQEIGAEVATLIGRQPPLALEEAVRHLVRFAASRIAAQARVYSDADSGFPDFVSRATERKKILDMAVDVIAAALSAAPRNARSPPSCARCLPRLRPPARSPVSRRASARRTRSASPRRAPRPARSTA